jgi:twinkle protein
MLDINASVAERRGGNGSQSGLSPEHAAYLRSRGVLRAAIRTGVQTITGRHAELIRFPYRRGFAKLLEPYSESPWTQRKAKNARLSLFNLENVDFSRTWILTEGEIDALSAIEVGEDNTASLPDGAVQPEEEQPAKSGKLAAIREAWPAIQAGGGQVVLALDNDAAGEATKDVLIDIFGRWRCKLIEWPAHENASGNDGKCKDFNEVLNLFGPDALRALIQKAKPIKLEGVFKPSEIRKRPPREYYSTGIPGMDEHLKLFRGELCVWTGHTGAGKSTSLLGVLCHLAQGGLRIGLAAFEADYYEDILPFVNTWLHGEQASAETEKDAHLLFDERFVLISHEIEPLQAPATIEWLIQQAQDAKGRFSIDCLVVEPWNKLQHKRRNFENETEYIGRALSELRNFAQAYNAIVIVSAHPTKESGKEGEVPSEFDIHGSMNWGNAADHVVIVYRPDKKLTLTLIKVAKSRFRKGGKEGEKWFVFSDYTNRYSPCAEHMIPNLKKDDKPRRKRAA